MPGPADMSESTVTKAERLQLRLDVAAKGRLQRAASHRQQSVSQFVLRSALEEAEKVIRENESITLADADWQLFYDALTNPPAPNAALQEGLRGLSIHRGRRPGEK